MPWSKDNVPNAAKKLTGHALDVFVAAANAALKQYDGDEGKAIATGLAAANKEKDKVNKSFFDSVKEILTKAFGESEKTTPDEVIKSEEMVSYEVVYEPNTKDAHGEWMSTETVAKACEDFNNYLEAGVVQPNLFHELNTDAFTIEKSWIVPEIDMIVEATGEKVKAGTWVAKIKYNNEHLWTLKKAGIVGGVSIGAVGKVNKKTGEITDVSFAPQEEVTKSMEMQTSKPAKKKKRTRLVYAPGNPAEVVSQG